MKELNTTRMSQLQGGTDAWLLGCQLSLIFIFYGNSAQAIAGANSFEAGNCGAILGIN